MNRKRVLAAALGVAVTLLPSVLVAQTDQNSNQVPQSSPVGPPAVTGDQAQQPSSMRDSLGTPGMTGQEMLDKDFLRQEASDGIAQMKIAELAVQKGSPDVKTFAQQVIDNHTEIAKDMDAVADRLGVMLPKKMNKDERAEYAKLEGLSGKDFDTEYVTFVVSSHRKALHDFRVEAATAADPGLASEAVKTAYVVRQHLSAAIKLAKDEGIVLPPRPPRRPRPGETPEAK